VAVVVLMVRNKRYFVKTIMACKLLILLKKNCNKLMKIPQMKLKKTGF
jgi:hypothetical protein